MPPAGGGILSGANAAIDLAVIGLRDGLAIAAARKEHHEISTACDIRGCVVHTKKLAKEIVELLFGFRLKELKHHVGRLLLNNQFGGTHVWHIIDSFNIEVLARGHQAFIFASEACELCSREKDLRAQAIFTNIIHFHTHLLLGAILQFCCKYTTQGVAKVVTPPILLMIFKKKALYLYKHRRAKQLLLIN